MKKEFKIKRKVSAIVAMALALVVSLIAATESYGEANIDPKHQEEARLALEEAYESIVGYEYFTPSIEENPEIIKIFDANNNLLEEVQLFEGEVIEDEQVQQLVNKAEYLSSFNNTTVYKVMN